MEVPFTPTQNQNGLDGYHEICTMEDRLSSKQSHIQGIHPSS